MAVREEGVVSVWGVRGGALPRLVALDLVDLVDLEEVVVSLEVRVVGFFFFLTDILVLEFIDIMMLLVYFYL